MSDRASAEATLRKIRRKTRWKFSTEEKIHIVIEGLRDTHSIADLCRREGINKNLYYLWRKELLETGEIELTQDLIEKLLEDEEVIALLQENVQFKETFHHLRSE